MLRLYAYKLRSLSFGRTASIFAWLMDLMTPVRLLTEFVSPNDAIGSILLIRTQGYSNYRCRRCS